MKKYTKDGLIAEYCGNTYSIYHEGDVYVLPKNYVEKYWEEVKEEDIIDKIIWELLDCVADEETFDDAVGKGKVKQILQKYFKDESKFIHSLLKIMVPLNNCGTYRVDEKDLGKFLQDYIIIRKNE